jgi:osmotically-inducible protein OsmY
MKVTAAKINHLIKRKIATAVLVTASVAAFATLGDGGGKKGSRYSNTVDNSFSSISLRTRYNYKSNNLFNPSEAKKYIILNTVVTYQKGNTTYILPLKKRVLLDKIKFNPAPVRF